MKLPLPPIVYVATPYSDPDPAVRQQRFERVNRLCGELFGAGIPFVSPISQSHPIAVEGGETSWEQWRFQDLTLLARCSMLLVYQQPGWEHSKGVKAESDLAEQLDLEFFWHPAGPLDAELIQTYGYLLDDQEDQEKRRTDIVRGIWEFDHSYDDDDEDE